jgi:hypothetical protein
VASPTIAIVVALADSNTVTMAAAMTAAITNTVTTSIAITVATTVTPSITATVATTGSSTTPSSSATASPTSATTTVREHRGCCQGGNHQREHEHTESCHVAPPPSDDLASPGGVSAC